MKVKYKKLAPEAVSPKIMKPGDAGADLTAVAINETSLYIEYDTGVAIELPPQHVGLLFPRSSCSNYHLMLSNCVGVCDENYRGSIKFRFKKTLDRADANLYKVGDRVGQLVVLPIPEVEYEEAEELSETVRGDKGYGSSGQ